MVDQRAALSKQGKRKKTALRVINVARLLVRHVMAGTELR